MFRLMWIVLVVICGHAIASEDQRETLVVTNSKAWKPFSFINEQGQPAGILVDYWQEFGRVNQIDIEFLLLDWDESLQAVKQGRADVHAGLLWSLERDKYFDFSEPIITIDTQLFISHALIGIEVSEFLSGNHSYTVGVVTGGYEQEYTSKNFPKLKLNTYRNNAEMIEAAFNGEIQSFIADLQVANYYLHTPTATKQFSGIYHMYSGIIRPAVKQDRGEMLVKLAKGMSKIPQEDKQRLFGRWMYIETVYPTFLVPFLAGLFVVSVICYLIVLKMSVKAKTKQLEKANSELKYLSEIDPLTGLSNRRHFYQEFKARTEARGPIGVLVFDIDDFKAINDGYGHLTGDRVIQQVGKVLSEQKDANHIIGRVGGEEFAIVVNKFGYQEVVDYANKICRSISNLSLFDDPQKQVTISLGCAYYSQADKDISLSDADSLMYKAKARGKNCVVSHFYHHHEKQRTLQFG